MNKFNDVKNPLLRAYNRAVVFFNIAQDSGQEAAKKYIEDFSDKDKLEILVIYKEVQKKGFPAMKRKLLESIDGSHYDGISSGEIEVEAV